MFLSPNSLLVKGREEVRKGKEISKMSSYRKLFFFWSKPTVATILRTGFCSGMWSLLPFPGENSPLQRALVA